VFLISLAINQYQFASGQSGEFTLHRTASNVREIDQLRNKKASLRLSE
jgi:hypothetical protein